MEENMESKYFGEIDFDWAGVSSEYKFKIPHFDKEVEVFLGLEFGDDGEETETLPTEDELLEYEHTLKKFLENINEIIIDIKEKTFDYYKEIYAKYYEEEFIVESFFITDKKEGEKHEALNINTQDKHFEYMKDINLIRILGENRILITIRYKLDREHGLEILFQKNRIINISGIGENYF
jgi:hypothetical protein